MSVAKHRVAAVSTLLAGVVVLIAWGRSQANETAPLRALRGQFQGRWIATLVQAGSHRKAEGDKAAPCRIAFDGKSVTFLGMIGGIDGRGTYLLQSKGTVRGVDLKLDAGWAIGIFEFDPDRLRLAINPLALPERLGVPTRGRPTYFEGSEGHHLYEFRRAMPGEWVD